MRQSISKQLLPHVIGRIYTLQKNSSYAQFMNNILLHRNYVTAYVCTYFMTYIYVQPHTGREVKICLLHCLVKEPFCFLNEYLLLNKLKKWQNALRRLLIFIDTQQHFIIIKSTLKIGRRFYLGCHYFGYCQNLLEPMRSFKSFKKPFQTFRGLLSYCGAKMTVQRSLFLNAEGARPGKFEYRISHLHYIYF